MSIPPSRLLEGLPRAKLNSGPLPKGMEKSSLPEIHRDFVGVHNLHHNDGFKHSFSRIQPTQAQVKERLGQGLSKLAVFEVDKGIPSAKLKLSRPTDPQGHISQGQAKKNFTRVQAGYNALHRELQKLALPENDPKHSRLAGVASFFKRLFGNRPPPELQFNANVVSGAAAPQAGAAQPAAAIEPPAAQPLPLQVVGGAPGVLMAVLPEAPAAPADLMRKVELTISTPKTHEKAGEPITFDSMPVSSYENKAGLRKGLWMGLTTLGGTVAAGAAVGGVVLAAPVIAAAGVVGGAAGGLYLLGKAIFGKSPWWGKTAEGQQQKELRQQARHAADEIAAMVKRQVLGDVSAHNLEAPEGGYIKKMVLDNPQMLTDFVALARTKDAKALQKAVRTFVVSKESPLPEQIRNDAKKYWFHNLFKGDPKGHAQKTVETVTREITRGIMQGVQEGVLQSMVADLSDELSDHAIDVLQKNGGAQARFNEFQEAVQGLYPSQTDLGHHIHETRAHTKNLQAFQRSVPRKLIEDLHGQKASLGEQNVKNYTDVLRKLDGDVQAHLASVSQIDALIHGDRSEDEAEPDDSATLDRVNRGISALLTEDSSPQEIALVKTALTAEIAGLRARVTASDDRGTQQLVQDHAKQFLDLLRAVQTSLELTSSAATTLAQARQDFSNSPTLELVKSHAAKLAALGDPFIDAGQANPAAFLDREIALSQCQTESQQLTDLCENLTNGADAAQHLRTKMAQGLVLAREGKLEQALSPDFNEGMNAELHQQVLQLKAWKDAGFTVPEDLNAVEDHDLSQWRAQAVGAALGLEANQVAALEPLLLHMSNGNHSEIITLVKTELLLADRKDAALVGLGVLNDMLPQVGDSESVRNGKAISCLQGLIKANMFNGQAQACSKLVQNLHPGALGPINKYLALDLLDQSMQALHGSDLGRKLYAWGEQERMSVPNYGMGYRPQTMLNLLVSFQNGNASSSPFLKSAANNVKDQLALTADLAQPLADWAVQTDKLKDLNQDDLDHVNELVSSCTSGLNKKINEDRFRAKAMGKAQAQQIVKGGQGSSDPRVRQAVSQASQVVEGGSAEQLQAQAQQIRLVQKDQAALVLNLRWGAEETQRLGDYLKTTLGYKGSVDTLVQRIAEHPELRSELMVLMHANAQLTGIASPPRLQHSFTQEQLLQGGLELGKYNQQASNYLNNLSPKLRDRISERNGFIGKFKDKGSEDIARLLHKEPSTQAYLENFLREEHAYGALRQDLKLDLPARSVRIILEGSADPTEQAAHHNRLTQTTALASANLNKLSLSLGQSLQKQKQALGHLQQTLTEQSGGSSSYLQAQAQLLDRQLEDATQLPQAFKAPHTGALAHMGALMLQASTCQKMNGKQIELGYLHGQLQASRDALKYFDPKRFNADRPGFFGRILFSLMRKGERLNRLLGAGKETQQALAKAIADIGKASLLQGQYKQQALILQNKLYALVETKNQLVNNPEKVKAAFVMLASEHLAAKQGDTARLSQADVQAVTVQWKAMLEGASKEAFPDIEEWSKRLVGQDIENLEHGLDPQGLQSLAKELGALVQQQNEFVASHRALRTELDRVELSKAPETSELTRLFEAGLDLDDQVLLNKLVETGAYKNEDITSLLNDWSRAGQACLKDPAAALFLAGRAFRGMENKAQSSNEMKRVDLVDLKDKLEESFLARLGPGAPQGLESNQASSRTSELIKELSQLSKDIRATQGASTQQLEQLARLDEQVMESFAEHPLSQLDGQQPPRSLKALDQLGVLRLELGNVYANLATKALASKYPVQTSALKTKAASHSYNGALIQQELLNPQHRWIAQGMTDDEQMQFNHATPDKFKENLSKAMKEHPAVFTAPQNPLNAAKAEALDDTLLGRVEMSRIDEPDLDSSIVQRPDFFAAVIESNPGRR